MQTPPSCPVIQRSGRSFGQVASTTYLGALCAWSTEGQSATASATAGKCNKVVFIAFLLFEFLAAEIDRFHRAHVGDVVERVLRQHEEVGGLALGERAEVLVDPQHLGIVLRERLN